MTPETRTLNQMIHQKSKSSRSDPDQHTSIQNMDTFPTCDNFKIDTRLFKIQTRFRNTQNTTNDFSIAGGWRHLGDVLFFRTSITTRERKSQNRRSKDVLDEDFESAEAITSRPPSIKSPGVKRTSLLLRYIPLEELVTKRPWRV